LGRRFVDLELLRGLAQRNRGRKTSYFDAISQRGKTPDAASTGISVAKPPDAFRLSCRDMAGFDVTQLGGKNLSACRVGRSMRPGSIAAPPPGCSSGH
jgi:hypothetical protein